MDSVLIVAVTSVASGVASVSSLCIAGGACGMHSAWVVGHISGAATVSSAALSTDVASFFVSI